MPQKKSLETSSPSKAAPQSHFVVQDALRRLDPGAVKLGGMIHEKIQQQIAQRFNDADLHAMVDFFAKRKSLFASGELWGKAVRSLSHIYWYTPDSRLKELLDRTVAEMLATQTPDGCISSFDGNTQPYNADLWCRKYVMLGLEGYYSITQDPKVLEAMKRMADYTVKQVGFDPKVRIVNTGWAFEGIESSSILEPMTRLYGMTGEQRYLDFARYIVEQEGGCRRENVYEAVPNGKDARNIGSNGLPKQSIAKQYELISNFEGLTEYYRATGSNHWRHCVSAFLHNVLETETTIVGCGGGLGNGNQGPAPCEQFNDSTAMQTCATREGIEGCASARWIALNDQLLRVTADSKLADNIEFTLYNAMLGSIKPDGTDIDYHSVLNGKRNQRVGYSVPINDKKITCCMYNVVDSLALIPFIAVMSSAAGPVVNLYLPGTAKVKLEDNNSVELETITDYPKTGSVLIQVTPEKTAVFTLSIRIPEWSKQTEYTTRTILKINGKPTGVVPGTYAELHREWSAGDKVELDLDMRCRVVAPPAAAPKHGQQFRALVRGPLVFAREKRLDENFDQPVAIRADAEGYVDATLCEPPPFALLQLSVPTQDGGQIEVIDFASAGGTWEADSAYFTWIPMSQAGGAGRVSPCI